MSNNATTIDSLQLEVTSSTTGATAGLDALTASLEKIKRATRGGLGLGSIINQTEGVGNAARSIDPTLAGNIEGLSKAVSLLGNTKISASIGNQITAISIALQGANFGDGATIVQSLVTALEPLGKLSKSNLSSYVTALKKLPQTFTELSAIDMGSFTAKIQELATALKPLGDEMQKVANGFSAFPAKIQKLIANTNQLSISNKKGAGSFTDLYHKIKLAKNSVMGIGRKVAGWIGLSSSYTETMNRFTISMGQYAKGAYDYAQAVGNAMGIDPAEWMSNQATFMTLGKGFGIVGERANKMSQQLTQLGYDLSSFFDSDVETAMLKLQSGFAGELEPLRRWGFDLSNARLEAVALSLGIDKAVSSMTQAEKAELRYYTIMTQVTDAHGDMARTLDSPTNQLRILKSQVTQLGRALGNFFIPILNKVLPYVIGAVRVLREVLDVFMNLLGITVSDVDWGDDSLTSATDDIVSNLEDGQKEAKKLKSYMLGFDELNVFSTDDGSEDLYGNGFDFELPTYDFMDGVVATKIDGIVAKMKEWLGITEDVGSTIEGWKTNFDEIFNKVVAIGAGIAAWKLTKSMTTFFTHTLPNLKKLLKDKSFMKGFNLALGVGLVVTGLVIGADVIQEAITTGLESVNIGELLASSALIIAGGTLIGKAFGKALAGASVAAIVIGVAGLGVALYDAIKNELNVTNGLTIAFSVALIGAGIGYLANGILGAAMGTLAGIVIGGAAAGALWIIQNVETTKEKILGIISAASLALGAILAFTGANIPLGVGLMAVGAVGLASQIAMNTKALSNEVKGVIAIITTAVSAAFLAVGAVLAFTGINIPLGIALIAGGALTMGASVVPKWDSLSKEVKNTITKILAIVGAAAMVIGAVLAFSGVGIPLGIGLMLAGAASLGTAAALNWDSLKNSLQGTLGKILAIVGAAAMVIGIILLFTGVGIPLGLGLLLGGAASLGTAVAFNWDAITNKVKGIFDTIKNAWNSFWNFIKTGINGFLGGIEWMVNGVIKGLNVMINALNKINFKIPDWVPGLGGKTFGLNLKTISAISIPRLAEGGFPNMGQMFIAREAGPELVGNIGSRTAVVNNDQIVESVSAGVYQAVLAALGSNNDDGGETAIIINLDGETIYRNQQKIAHGRGYNMGMGAFSFG